MTMARRLQPIHRGPTRAQTAKGSEFERWVCRELTRWITGSTHPEIFWRSATSGAKATQGRRKGQESVMGGDIVAVDERGFWLTSRFSVECKHRKTFGSVDALLKGGGDLMGWWVQCCADARASGKLPMMIFKQLRSQAYIGLPAGLVDGPYDALIGGPPSVRLLGVAPFERWLGEHPYEELNQLNVRGP